MATIRIDDAEPANTGVTLPVNLMIDPESGVAEDAPLRLVVDVTVNEQAFADAPVSVSAAETVTVTTDPQGRFEVLALEFGSWEELTSPDGVDVVVEFDPGTGSVEVAFQLLDGTSDPATPLTPVTTRAFDVEPDGETLAGRIAQDYRDASLSADDAARYSLLSAIDPEYRAAPYADLYDDDVPEDPQALGLFAATLYDEVSDETRAELDEYLTADLPPGSADTGQDASRQRAAADPGDYPDCVEIETVWRCATHIDSTAPEAGGAPIDLIIAYTLGSGPGHVEDVDQNQNHRPDRIDFLVNTLVRAWRFYRDELGMNAVEDTVVVQLLATPGGGGLSVPGISVGGTIFIPPTADEYLVRHELFHQVQYQYLSTADIAAHFHPMIWLMESSAEWASYEAEQHLGPGLGNRGLYADDLPHALGAPHRTLDDTDEVYGGPEYGSFPFIEYLDQAHGGYAAVEAVLTGSGDGAAGHRPTDVIADHVGGPSSSWAQAIVAYRQWTYLLTRDANHGVGFEAPDGDADGLNDIDEYWRDALQNDRRTAGSEQRYARPARVRRDYSSVQGTFSLSGYASVHPGGARYIEIQLPPDTASIDVDVDTDSDNIHATTMLTSQYPALCQAPTTVAVTPPGSQADVTVDDDCTTIVLALVNTARPGGGQDAVQVRYLMKTGAGRLEVDGQAQTLTFTEHVRQQRLRFEGSVGQRLRLALQYRQVRPWFYVLDPNGHVFATHLTNQWYPDIGLPELPVSGRYTIVAESMPSYGVVGRVGDVDVRLYDQQMPTDEFYATYSGDIGIVESSPPLPYTDALGDGAPGEPEIVDLDASFADNAIRVEVTLSHALGPSQIVNVEVLANTFSHASGARGDRIGQGWPFVGPCGDRATWSQSGLTYIYEAPWACDRGKTSPWMRAQATRGSDIAPERTPQKFPGDVVRTFRDTAGPVPGWGTVPLDLTGPQ